MGDNTAAAPGELATLREAAAETGRPEPAALADAAGSHSGGVLDPDSWPTAEPADMAPDIPEWLVIPTRTELAALAAEARANAEADAAADGDSVVYTLHFDPPYKPDPDAPAYKTAGHYTGFAEHLDERLARHAAGQGARLTQVQLEAGGTWRLADVRPGTRYLERQLKQHGAARRCPICRLEAQAKAETAAEASAGPKAATEAEAVEAETGEPELDDDLELEI
jgi:predicted GIY-YIG superfamily endonuclease